jgi:hypothetical protein
MRMPSVAPVSLWEEEEHSCEISEAPPVQGVAAVTLSLSSHEAEGTDNSGCGCCSRPFVFYEAAEVAVAAEDMRGYPYDGSTFMDRKHDRLRVCPRSELGCCRDA